MTQVIAHNWAMNMEKYNANKDDIEELDNFKKAYLVNGTAPQYGQIFKNIELANTLEIIAAKGRDAYYQGGIADVIDAYMQRTGVPLRKSDLKSHKSEWVKPQSVNYRDYDVYELPPNGQGIAALQMLNVLELYQLPSMWHNSADYLHVHAEAKKLAFADRAKFYADPDFYKIPLEGLLSKEYARKRNELVDMGAVSEAVTAGNPRLEKGDTIYMTVADKDGMMVSLIQGNYNGMDSGLVADGLGFYVSKQKCLVYSGRWARKYLCVRQETVSNNYSRLHYERRSTIPQF